MPLDGLGEFSDPEINGALADAVAVGVAVNAGQCARLAHGKHDVVKLAVGLWNHGVNDAAGVTAGGVFIGGNVVIIRQTAGPNATRAVVVVDIVVQNGKVGHVPLLFFARHVA